MFILFIILIAALLYFQPETNVQLVISRYNENLAWLQETPYNNYRNIIYNKSENMIFHTTRYTQEIIQVPNVGRCDHTFLYHVITHYDRLAPITVFLAGSQQLPHKRKKSTRLLKEIKERKKNVFIGVHVADVKTDQYNFQLDQWTSSDDQNKVINVGNKLEPAQIRPFGPWFEATFPNIKIQHMSYYGIVSVSQNEIHQHPIQYYEKLIKELSNSSNPEAGHYFERSWEAVFYPMKDTVFLEE